VPVCQEPSYREYIYSLHIRVFFMCLVYQHSYDLGILLQQFITVGKATQQNLSLTVTLKLQDCQILLLCSNLPCGQFPNPSRGFLLKLAIWSISKPATRFSAQIHHMTHFQTCHAVFCSHITNDNNSYSVDYNNHVPYTPSVGRSNQGSQPGDPSPDRRRISGGNKRSIPPCTKE
jgi:hypothetical protein